MICLPRRDDFLWVGRFSSVGVVWWFDLFLLCSALLFSYFFLEFLNYTYRFFFSFECLDIHFYHIVVATITPV